MTFLSSFALLISTKLNLKVLLEWIQFWHDMVTLVVQINIQKTRTQNMQ